MWDIKGIQYVNAVTIVVSPNYNKVTADEVRQIMGAEELHICHADEPDKVLYTLHKVRCNVHDLSSSVIRLNCGETTLTPHINNILVAGETVGISIQGVNDTAWLKPKLATDIIRRYKYRLHLDGPLAPTSDVC